MASPTKAQPSSISQPKPPKLPRLPKNARIQKRPLLHPPIPSPYASSSQQKVIYISPHTPFISAVKRVRKLLDQIDKRAVGAVDLINSKSSDQSKLRKLEEKVAAAKAKRRKQVPEEVVLKATNRAIEKALGLGCFFQGQGDVRVRIRTGTVGVVDDIIEEEGEVGGDVDVEMEEGEELPEARVRHLSFVEVAITLK